LWIIVKVSVKARKVTVTGPKGTITKDLSHMAIDMRVMKMNTKKMKGLYVRIQMWNGKSRHACAVSTFKSLINNMFIGTTEVSNLLDDHKCYCVWCVLFCFQSII
jgi:large subunit ribosomal protein L9e